MSLVIQVSNRSLSIYCEQNLKKKETRELFLNKKGIYFIPKEKFHAHKKKTKVEVVSFTGRVIRTKLHETHVTSVSYTHLDVYKRQSKSTSVPM